ncbi:hypothetical protein X771_11620 [Mesorhizobium sp. LSJC277A00]|nr:hypothetical protein X771_11620 [Mesorhizobium sp. LSJC277A00]
MLPTDIVVASSPHHNIPHDWVRINSSSARSPGELHRAEYYPVRLFLSQIFKRRCS